MVPEQEKEHLKKNTDIETICSELNQNGRYSFTVHQISEDGEIRLKEFNFMYMFKELGIILAVTEDITELSGKDVLTGGYNRQGFIHNSENIFRHCDDRTDYAVLYFTSGISKRLMSFLELTLVIMCCAQFIRICDHPA